MRSEPAKVKSKSSFLQIATYSYCKKCTLFVLRNVLAILNGSVLLTNSIITIITDGSLRDISFHVTSLCSDCGRVDCRGSCQRSDSGWSIRKGDVLARYSHTDPEQVD